MMHAGIKLLRLRKRHFGHFLGIFDHVVPKKAPFGRAGAFLRKSATNRDVKYRFSNSGA
jgi:hypothetical protein